MRGQERSSPVPVAELGFYDERVIVAGTREYRNYRFFCETMDAYHASLGSVTVVYLSGLAKSGADEMVVRWCKDRGHPWAEFPAHWDDLEAPGAVIKHRQGPHGTIIRYNVRAGFFRNTQMAEHATRLVTFHDGVSTGTAHMTKLMLDKVGRDKVLTIIVDVEAQEELEEMTVSHINGVEVVRPASALAA